MMLVTFMLVMDIIINNRNITNSDIAIPSRSIITLIFVTIIFLFIIVSIMNIFSVHQLFLLFLHGHCSNPNLMSKTGAISTLWKRSRTS